MVISSKGRYALRVMVYLAVNHDGSFIPLKEISQHEELSQKYLESIIIVLGKSGDPFRAAVNVAGVIDHTSSSFLA